MERELKDYAGELLSNNSDSHSGRVIECNECLANFTYPTKEAVHNRACEAIGKTMGEIANAMNSKISAKKSQTGYAWESWFGVATNSEAAKDLVKADVELKSTGVIDTRNGKSAKERLVLNVINYITEYKVDFYNSSFWEKNNRMEIGFYAYDKTKNWMDFELLQSALFEFPEKDLAIIKQDFELIQEYIVAGKAHELSESLTMYLGACPKGKNKDDKRDQHPDLNAPRAMQRAYALKNSYMTYIVRNYVFGALSDDKIRIHPFTQEAGDVEPENQVQSVIQDLGDYLEGQYRHLGEYIHEKTFAWIGKNLVSIASSFDIWPNLKGEYPKNIKAMLVSRMLGTLGDLQKSEEFQKAGITVKTITVNENNTIEENMSFPAFKFKEIVQESWEESTLRNFFESAKFFFVVFKKDAAGNQFFQGAKFFSIPQEDLDGPIKMVWNETVDTISRGVSLYTKNGKPRVYNNFVKESEGRIIHVRPHAAVASYHPNTASSDELPVHAKWTDKPAEYSDDWMTKQCFWLNKSYVLEHIKDILV